MLFGLALKECFMLNKAKEFALGIILTIALCFVVVMIIQGAVWFSSKIYPWLLIIFSITLLVTIVVLLPLSIPPKTRNFAGNYLYIASYIFGATLWIWGILLTYILLGGFGVFIGLFMAGVGVVPISMIATLINGMWSELLQIIIQILLTFGTRYFGYRLLVSYLKAKEMHANNKII
jgi:hypothetical protein